LLVPINVGIFAKKYMKVILILSFLIIGCNTSTDKKYCGKVTEKYLLHKNNGGTHNIVFYVPELGKKVNVSVTADTYVNTDTGQNICFTLSDYQINK
jgi:predicted component of type VI protein secretion system